MATYRSEPASFNRLAFAGSGDNLVARLVHDTLLRTDRKTGQLEPRLALNWTPSPDGRTWTLPLRKDVVFSDGQPFTAEDVLFTVRALYDPATKSQIASSLQVDGQPIQVRALDPHTIAVQFPTAFAPGISLLESLPILPAHKLRAAFDAGTFRDAWSLSTPLTEIVGLGPFVIDSYKAREGMAFRKNARFWKRDAEGRPMPYLDRIEMQFTPSQDTELLRLQAGAADLMTDKARVEDIASLRQLSASGKVVLHDAGISISPDLFWFNLDPASPTLGGRQWLQRDEFRHAVSQSIDRMAVVNTVFLGEAVPIAGPITPGHGSWYTADLVKPVYDVTAAAKTFESLGLVDRNGDGLRDDASGRTASFTLLTQQGNTVRERSSLMIQEQLRKVGIKVDVVPMDWRVMIGTNWQESKYDAIFFGTESDAFDPGRNGDFWLSSGSFHAWRPGQATPATPWEKEIDSLMTRQSTTMDVAERRRLFVEAQKVFAAHEPVIYLAAPKVVVPVSSRLGGVSASVMVPNVLWNAEALFIK